MTFDNVKESAMNEEQCATAVHQTIQTVKKHLGPEKTVGMVMGAVVGEVLLSGGTKDQLLQFCNEAWDAFKRATSERQGP